MQIIGGGGARPPPPPPPPIPTALECKEMFGVKGRSRYANHNHNFTCKVENSMDPVLIATSEAS